MFGGCYGWEGCAKEESCFQGSIYTQVPEVGLQRSSFPGCLRHSLNNSGQSCSKLHGLVSDHGLEEPRQDGFWLWSLQAQEDKLPRAAAVLGVCTLAPVLQWAVLFQG